MNNNYLGRTATEKIASDIKDSSHYGSTPVVENKGNQYIKGQYDLLPNNITTASLEQDDVVSSYIKSVYSNASNGKGFSSEDRFLVDVLASTILGVDYMEVATHRDKYIPLLVGRTDLDDKGILEAWVDNWQSYGYQKKLANKMNQFDKSKDEEEKMVLLEEIENINNELFKLGDYNSRNALGRGFTQSASITRQGLTTLGWTAAGALLGGGLGAIAGGATASSAIPAAVSALKTATTASKIGKAIGLTGDVIFNTFATERGSFSYELYNLVDADGNRLDDSIRNATATLGAMAVSAIEYINFPDQSINNFIKGKVAKEVVKKASIEWAKDFGMKMLKGSIGESLEEAIQSFVSDITRHMAQSYSDTTKGTKFDLRMQEEFTKYLSGAIESFASSFLPSLFAGAPGNFRESLGTYSGFKNSENIEVEKKMSYKDAKKLQNVTSETTVISFDKINLKSEAPTKQYGKTTDANGKEVDAKLDPIKVMRDPEDRSRFIPVDDDEMDKAKWLRNNRAKGIAVEIVDSNDIVRVTKEAWENTVSGYSGTIEGNAITFASESEMKAFDQFAKSVGIGKSITGEYLIADENGNTVAYSASVSGSNENARAQEVLKTVEPTLVMNIKKALGEAGANVSDREIALASRLAGMLGNSAKVTVLSENDKSVTEVERRALIGSRGITNFTADTANSIRIILSKNADATTIVHEMFHVALRTNKEARTRLISSFKQTLADDKTRAELKQFYEEHMEILQDNDLKTADDVLAVLDLMEEDNVFTDSIFEEVLTKTFEAFDASNNLKKDKRMPIAIKKFFQEISDTFKSIYKSITGKDLSTLPSKVESSYKSFLNTKENSESTIRKQEEVQKLIEEINTPVPSDILKQKVSAEKQEELEKEETITLYRAMQVFDGELYSPMSSEIKGKRKEPTLFGVWYKSDENPELAKPVLKNGKPTYYPDGRQKYVFKLEKGGKDASGKKYTDVDAAYNPYWHSSLSPLNDQFSSAYKRPNLVTVEVEVPVSELDGEYMAEKAKDSVGMKDWHSGPVSSKLAKIGNPRKVMLSQYCKVNRVIPDIEVAEKIKQMLDGTNISIPSNTITPSLRAELEKIGVEIEEIDEVSEFNTLYQNNNILKQDILDTTLLEEGSARKTLDDFKEADVVAEIEAVVFMPEVVLEKYESNPIVKKELEERELLKSLASDAEKLIAARSESIGAFISQMRDYHGEAFGDAHEALYRKFYTYANTMTPQQMREWFIGEFSTIDKLMALKAMLSPRRVAKMQNGKVINALYVPKTSYVYSLIRDLNLNSSKEDVDKVLNSIKKDTNAWVKAYIRSKADYQKFRAFENNSREYLQSLAEIAYLSLSDAEFGFLRTIRNANDDGTVAETKKELRELKKELKAFGSVPEDDETYIEASKHFYEDELEALREEIGEEAYRVALEKDRKYEAEIESIRKKLAEKQYDAVTRERWLAKKRLLEKQREAEILLVSTKNAAKIRQDKLKEKYEIRIDQLNKEKNQIISDLKVMRDLKLIEKDEYWRNSKAQAILREKNWRKISEEKITSQYELRIKALELRKEINLASQKLDKQIRRSLNLNLKTHDAFALDSIKYVANLIVRKNYNGMDSAEYDRYRTRTGKEDEDIIIFQYVDVDDNGDPILDADGNEQMVSFEYNAGAENYSKDTIPAMMVKYLKQSTIDALHADDFSWSKLTVYEKENILDALLSVREEAKASMEYKNSLKRKAKIDISSSAIASILKSDDPISLEDRARIAEILGMKGTEPNFEQKAQTYFAQHIDQFVQPPEKPKKFLGIVAATFGHIQSVAYALDGNKEGPIYDLFVNKVQKAIDGMSLAVSKRNKEASEAFDAIWESGDVSRADKQKWFSAKYEIGTNSFHGGTQKMTGWNLMGAYIYSQNVHGFIKLVSDKGNNISMEEMARINPEYTYRMIEEDLRQRKEFREHEVSRMDYHAKRGTQFEPLKYEGLLYPFSEVELVRIKGLIETNNIESIIPQFAREMGDKMIELLSKYTEDMNKVAYELYNMPFTEQSRYFPLVGAVNVRDVSLTEFMQRKKSVSHGFILERKMKRDYELLLDPMNVFYSAIEAQERMVHLTTVVNQMNSLLSPNQGNFGKIVEERYGSKMLNYLNSQLAVLAGDNYRLSDWEKMTNALIQNLAVSKIGLNLMTSLKQFGSLITALTDGEINIVDFIRQFQMERSAKANLYETLAPEIAHSSIELDVARMKKANQTTKAGTKLANIQEFSTALTQNVDQMVKKWVWTASYMKSVDQGMSESDAAVKATALVKRTQSISSEYDLSQIQRTKNPLTKMVFMFTNDLFQMWNRLALGIPSDIKNKNYWRALEKGLGSVVVAGFLSLAACGWLPEEEEDKFDEKSFLKDMLQNLMAFTPIVGTAMEDAVSGMRSNLTNLPAEFVNLMRMPFKGSDEYELEDYVDQFYDTLIDAVGFTGMPTLAADRAMKILFPNGIDDGLDFNAGNFAYLFVGSRAGDYLHRIADEIK